MSEAFNSLSETHIRIIAKFYNIADYTTKPHEELVTILNEFFGGLELEQFQVLAKYYGLANYEVKTLEELKDALIVHEAISRINCDINQTPSLNITRDPSNNNYYLEFVKPISQNE